MARPKTHAVANPALARGLADLRRSGAAGVHDDQKARHRHAAGRTNRVGTRRAAKAAAIRADQS